MKRYYFLILPIIIMISSCNNESHEIDTHESSIVEFKSPCGLSVSIESIDYLTTKTREYETFIITIQDENGNSISEGVIEYIEEDEENVAYVYSSTGDLMFTYTDNGDSVENIVVYDEYVTTLAADYQYGLRKRGETYRNCLSRVSEETIIMIEENTHRLILYMMPNTVVVAAAIYVGVVGCTKYEDQPL